MKSKRVSGKAFAKIADGDSIYEGWGANQGFLTTKKGVMVVDTGFTAGTARALMRDVRSTTSAPVRLVVNTHDHSDHVFGNSVFYELSPCIVAHASCRSRLLEMGKERIAGYRQFDARLRSGVKGLHIVPAQVTYEHGLEFTLCESPVKLIHPEDGAHTIGDTMVFLPEEKVLFAGDVVWVDYHPNLEDANIEGWLRALEAISKLDVDHVVPGHGHVSDKGCVAPLARYLREFDQKFRRLVRDGVSKRQIPRELEIAGTEDWKLKTIVERNVEMLHEKYLAEYRT